MSWNNDNVPKIILDYDDSNMRAVSAQVSAVLDKNGFGDGGRVIRLETALAHTNAEKAVTKTADETVQEVATLMRMRQYHSKSGYGPGTKAFEKKANNQHMVDNLKDHVDGNRHEIYTTTTNDGYNYSQAFEFGLLTRNYPAQHPFQDTASLLNLNTTDGLFEDEVCSAIRKGYHC